VPHSYAWPERCERWAEIQVALGNQLAVIGSDANARDLARITRIPGSVNSKVNVRVAYWVQHDEQGQVPIYTLTNLAGLCGINSEPKLIPATVKRVTTIYKERASKGQAGRWLRARENFERLWKVRNGFRAGTRNSAVLYYTIILKSLPGSHRLSDEQVEITLLSLWKDFEQPAGARFSGVATTGVLTTGANLFIARASVPSVTNRGVLTMGANVVIVSAAGDGTTTPAWLAVTTGANVESVRAVVAGVTSRGALTVGANVAMR